MARINVFENAPTSPYTIFDDLAGNGTLHIHGVYIPGSISFNNVVYGLSASATNAKTISVLFGLYSLNGSTLSLANSASATKSNFSAISWVSLVTSATQDIAPGNWYLAVLSLTAGTNQFSFMLPNLVGGGATAGAYAGVFVRGIMSVSTNAMPASIATSDCKKELNSGTDTSYHPYVIISA